MKQVRSSIFIFMVFILLIITACAAQETVRPAPPITSKPAKIALVLGAGASRGFAHIGVLKVLEANKVPIHMIIGTSAGSFVGSLSAYGFSGFQLQKMALAITKGDLVDLTFPDNGFIKGDKLEEYVNNIVKNTPIERFRTPFYAVAAAIPSGQETIFGQGNAGMAVRASCSIPGVFRPKKIADRMYVDGGVVSPVAVDAAKKYGADVVLAVDIAADPDARQPEGTIETILQSVNIMYSKLSAIQLVRADVVMKPKVGHIGSGDFDKRHKAIVEGEKAATEVMPAIQGLIARLRQEGRLD